MSYLVVLLTTCFSSLTMANDSAVNEIRTWTQTPQSERQPFEATLAAKQKISKSEAVEIAKLLWNDYADKLRKERRTEWDNKVIQLGDLRMKFDYKVFGEKPADGRRLFISMHGGGGTAARVNDGQWRNQIRLYQPEEGVYLAPRAPTDAWNMWHKEHIDTFFRRIIQSAILFADVNPDRVYIMGYSAGGDGVYQLAPRMADLLAAAAMMAGHPNNASPLGLRNIGFALHMGEHDRAYQRNQIASQWKQKLAQLQRDDPGGYQHQVRIHKGLGHWMQRKDAVAVPWMSRFQRDVNPKKIVWFQDEVVRDDFYWLAVQSSEARAGNTIVVSRAKQVFEIEAISGTSRLTVLLNDDLVDMDRPISINFNEQELVRTSVERKPIQIYRSIERFGDPKRIYYSQIEIDIPKPMTLEEE